MTDKELADMLKSTHYKYPNTFLGSAELVTIGHICKLAAERIEHLQSENTRLKVERDEAVELTVKLMKIFVIPQKDYDKYFRKLKMGTGVYMGTGYAVMDAFFRVYDDFVENADDIICIVRLREDWRNRNDV